MTCSSARAGLVSECGEDVKWLLALTHEVQESTERDEFDQAIELLPNAATEDPSTCAESDTAAQKALTSSRRDAP